MNHKLTIIILFLGFGLHSCSELKKSNNNLPSNLDCESLSGQPDYMTLTGTLVVDPKGELVFKGITDDSLGIACPTFLIPCGKGNNDYIEEQYIGYTRIRSIEEGFWISISGKYANLDHYKKQDDNFERLEFQYDWVALIDNPIETNVFNISDSVN